MSAGAQSNKWFDLEGIDAEGIGKIVKEKKILLLSLIHI